MRYKISWISILMITVLGVAVLCSRPGYAKSSAVELAFTRAKRDPLALLIFLQDMPKGGELHYHLAGASYPRYLLEYNKNSDFCIERDTFQVKPAVECRNGLPIKDVFKDIFFFNDIINAWSMRQFVPGNKSAPAHFFRAIMELFMPLIEQHRGEMLAEVANRAAAERVSYLEVIILPQFSKVLALADQVNWQKDLATLHDALLVKGLSQVTLAIENQLSQDLAVMRQRLACGTAKALPGCHVTLRFLYAGLRSQPPQRVFTALAVASRLVHEDPRFVGVNLVAPEDAYYSLRDYPLHMRMVRFFKNRYPALKVSLHAGEFNAQMVPPENLADHIGSAVRVGKADRIGHGTAIAYEKHAAQTLQYMAKHGVLVEVNLTSNDLLLGVKGPQHPFALYRQYGVPMALSTDDPGLLRTTQRRELARAIRHYDISYPELKVLIRNSLRYSFLPGKSLLSAAGIVPPCRHDLASKTCLNWLKTSEKARQQWRLEQALRHFEAHF